MFLLWRAHYNENNLLILLTLKKKKKSMVDVVISRALIIHRNLVQQYHSFRMFSSMYIKCEEHHVFILFLMKNIHKD